MKVYFHEIKEQDLVYNFDETTPWIMEVVGALDEKMDRIQRPPNWKPRSRPTKVQFTLRRVEDLVHVSGKVKTQLFLLCSLCAEAFHFPINLQFHTLLTQSEVYAEAPRETSRKGNLTDSPFEDEDEDDDLDDDDDEGDEAAPLDLNPSDFEVTVVKEPFADLKEILNEQIVLTLPMQPKPDQDEKGDCVKCGRAQIDPPTITAAAAPLKENPFAILKDYKKKSDS